MKVFVQQQHSFRTGFGRALQIDSFVGWKWLRFGRSKPAEAGVANDSKQPGASVGSVKAVEVTMRPQERVVHDVFCILVASQQPTRKVVGRVQVRIDGALEVIGELGLRHVLGALACRDAAGLTATLSDSVAMVACLSQCSRQCLPARQSIYSRITTWNKCFPSLVFPACPNGARRKGCRKALNSIRTKTAWIAVGFWSAWLGPA